MPSASGNPERVGRRPRPLKLRVHGWLRWLHIYISMFSLLAILFFSLTGITLNHPDWSISSAETHRDLSGKLPAGWQKNGEVDWFQVVEHLRATHGLRGRALDQRTDGDESSVSFHGPGYSADCVIEDKTGEYTVSVTAQGFVGILNDLHRGRDAGAAWSWVVDFSGVLLTIVSLTGIGLLWYLKKVRVAAFITLAGGTVLVFVLMKLAL